MSICTGVNTRYQARVRRPYCHKWQLVGGPMVSEAAAIDLMTQAFSVVPGRYKRADVIMYADYYDPIQVCELVRK